MIYNILGIIVGFFATINSILVIVSKKERLSISILNLLCSLAFIVTGIVGFFVPENFSIIPVTILLVLAVAYLIFNYVLLKKGKTSQTHKANSTKK